MLRLSTLTATRRGVKTRRMDKSLRQFRSSLETETDDKEALIAKLHRVDSALDIEYSIRTSSSNVYPGGIHHKEIYTITGHSFSTNAIRKLVASSEGKLARLEEKFDRINDMYPKEIAETIFSDQRGGGLNKSAILNALLNVKQQSLVSLCCQFTNLRPAVECIENISFAFRVYEYKFTINIVFNYKDKRIYYASQPHLYFPVMSGIHSTIRFLLIYKEIEDKVKQVMDNIVGEGVMVEEVCE